MYKQIGENPTRTCWPAGFIDSKKERILLYIEFVLFFVTY